MPAAPSEADAAAPASRAAAPPPARILLIGNHPADRQESMQRFAGMLHLGLERRGFPVRLIAPPARLLPAGRWDPSGPARWLGYLDKFLVFPTTLARHLAWAQVVHICDHGNAMYTRWTAAHPTLVTCHDLLAVRAALGDATDCAPSRAGRYLQRWIVAGMRQANLIAAVSRATLGDVDRLIGVRPERTRLVHNGLNHPYRQQPGEQCRAILGGPARLQERPFIVHVGSNEARKNRAGVLRVFAQLAQRWPGDLVFVGRPLNAELMQQARDLGVAERVHQLSDLDNPRLEALYNLAHALLFPSTFEGFGWPIIEAQACGCPVVCSDCAALLEIAGPGACVRPLRDEAGMAGDLLRLADPAVRRAHVAAGLENARAYSADAMIDAYARLYRDLAVTRNRSSPPPCA